MYLSVSELCLTIHTLYADTWMILDSLELTRAYTHSKPIKNDLRRGCGIDCGSETGIGTAIAAGIGITLVSAGAVVSAVAAPERLARSGFGFHVGFNAASRSAKKVFKKAVSRRP